MSRKQLFATMMTILGAGCFLGLGSGVPKAIAAGGDNKVAIQSPNGGETLEVDKPVPITWEVSGKVICRCVLSFSGDGGGSWTIIDSNVGAKEGMNQYTWHPSVTTKHGRISVEGYSVYDYFFASDISHGDFEVKIAEDKYAWVEGSYVCFGTSWDLDQRHGLYPYKGKSNAVAVGAGIAGSNDHVYVWYNDGTVSSGTSSDWLLYRKPYGYTLPSKKIPSNIVGMAIAGSNDFVYTWYDDHTVSVGKSWDLAAYKKPYKYTLPPNKYPTNIVGMAIAGTNDRVYVWYDDGMVSSGTSSDLDAYRKLSKYTLPPGRTPADILVMGIAGSNDFVYTWFRSKLY